MQQLLKTQNINPSHRHLPNFLKNRTHNSHFFVSPTNKSELQNIIFLLDSNKSVGPNSIPMKILKSRNNDVSRQLADVLTSHSPQVFFQL